MGAHQQLYALCKWAGVGHLLAGRADEQCAVAPPRDAAARGPNIMPHTHAGSVPQASALLGGFKSGRFSGFGSSTPTWKACICVRDTGESQKPSIQLGRQEQPDAQVTLARPMPV